MCSIIQPYIRLFHNKFEIRVPSSINIHYLHFLEYIEAKMVKREGCQPDNQRILEFPFDEGPSLLHGRDQICTSSAFKKNREYRLELSYITVFYFIYFSIKIYDMHHRFSINIHHQQSDLFIETAELSHPFHLSDKRHNVIIHK